MANTLALCAAPQIARRSSLLATANPNCHQAYVLQRYCITMLPVVGARSPWGRQARGWGWGRWWWARRAGALPPPAPSGTSVGTVYSNVCVLEDKYCLILHTTALLVERPDRRRHRSKAAPVRAPAPAPWTWPRRPPVPSNRGRSSLPR